MTALVHTGAVREAFASWGRWVAWCGHCQFNAGNLTPCVSHFRCSFCHGVTEIIWPSLDMIRGVERLLMMRPDPSTRSWAPPETLSDLMWENGQHGIFDDIDDLDLELPPGSTLLFATDDRIKIDNLPKVLPAVRRLEIGGGPNRVDDITGLH